MGGAQVLAVFVFILVAAAVVYLVYLYYKKRREALLALANALGLQYSPRDIFGITNRFYNFSLFREGHSRRAYDLIYGDKDGMSVLIFDYAYNTGSGKNEHTYRYTACILTMDVNFPFLVIRPENVLDKVASFVGFDDIDFESAQFSREFFVKSKDRKFAYDMVHQGMMEFLLSSRKAHIEIGGGDFLFHYNKAIGIPERRGLYEFAREFIKKIPDYVLDREKER